MKTRDENNTTTTNTKETSMPSNLNNETILLTRNMRIISHHNTFAEALVALRGTPSSSITTWRAFKALLEAAR